MTLFSRSPDLGGDPGCPDLNPAFSQVITSEFFGCDTLTATVPDFPTGITYSSGIWDEQNEK